MATVASRDLRNHTSAVLKQVTDGVDVTITVHGEPVAVITRPRSARRGSMPRADFFARLAGRQTDVTLADDMAWISGGTTDDLGAIR